LDRYVCSICGYIYDEAKGIPEAGIAPGTGFKDLQKGWVCPLCNAPKAEFQKQGEPAFAAQEKPLPVMQAPTDEKALSSLEMSALCTNLARGCEKQYKPEEAALFNELGKYFKAVSAPAEQPDINELMGRIEKDLSEGFPNAHATATEAQDRGALRALVWSEKVTRILKSLLARYQKEGEAMLQNTDVHVCTICGFIHIGDTLPEICPVCKVANWKFEKVEGR
jgi:rubredoxin